MVKSSIIKENHLRTLFTLKLEARNPSIIAFHSATNVSPASEQSPVSQNFLTGKAGGRT
jgi:hypothetical protein